MLKSKQQQNIQEGIPQTDAPLVVQLFGFAGDSIVDGPGLRCVVFCQGCPHGCPGCHNPASHSFGGGQPSTVDELFSRIQSYPLCKGVTFSGGEPFCQPEALAELAKQLKTAGKELAAYTGYTFEELQNGTPAQQNLLSLLDILVDGRFELQQRNLNLLFRGSENQRILNVQQSLAAGKAVWETAARWVGGA